jgi:hypothetical protein
VAWLLAREERPKDFRKITQVIIQSKLPDSWPLQIVHIRTRDQAHEGRRVVERNDLGANPQSCREEKITKASSNRSIPFTHHITIYKKNKLINTEA